MSSPVIADLEDEAVRLVESGRYEEARTALKKLLSRDRENLTGHFQMALVKMHLGHLPAAMKHARTVLRLSPDEPNAWLNIGAIAQRMERLPLAIECYQKELVRHPESRESLFNLGICMHDLKQWGEAIRPLQECVRLKYCFDLVWPPLAECLYRTGAVNDEIAVYEWCLLQDSRNVWARANLGAALMGLGQSRRALVNLRIARSQGADYPSLLNNLNRFAADKSSWPELRSG